MYHFSNMDKYQNVASLELGLAENQGQKIWHIFQECMELIEDQMVIDFQIEKPSFDQVYEKVIYEEHFKNSAQNKQKAS